MPSHSGIALIDAVPDAPDDVQRLCTVVVWQAPSQPNGEITGYEIEFEPGMTHLLNSQTGFYLTTEEERKPGTLVKVTIMYMHTLVESVVLC